MAALGEVPFGRYYGSVDATPLFVMLAGAYLERTGDSTLIRELWPAIERALAWIDGPGDIDGDGFVEYARGVETGLANQGWKDSHDAVFHADGSLAQGPIALVEVQGYVYAAKRAAAACAHGLGLGKRGDAVAAAGRGFARSVRAGVLVRGNRHVRPGARRRQAALQRAHEQCRPSAVHRHRERRTGCGDRRARF